MRLLTPPNWLSAKYGYQERKPGTRPTPRQMIQAWLYKSDDGGHIRWWCATHRRPWYRFIQDLHNGCGIALARQMNQVINRPAQDLTTQDLFFLEQDDVGMRGWLILGRLIPQCFAKLLPRAYP